MPSPELEPNNSEPLPISQTESYTYIIPEESLPIFWSAALRLKQRDPIFTTQGLLYDEKQIPLDNATPVDKTNVKIFINSPPPYIDLLQRLVDTTISAINDENTLAMIEMRYPFDRFSIIDREMETILEEFFTS